MDDEIASIVEEEIEETPSNIAQIEAGSMHETYELSCDEEEYILQISSDADKGQVAALRRGLNCYVMLEKSGVPIPRVVTEEIREFNGRNYTLVEKLPGKTGVSDLSPTKVRNAGRCLAQIHDARSFDKAGWIRFEDQSPSIHTFREGGLKQQIERNVEKKLSVLQEEGLETARNEVKRVFDQSGENLPEEFQPVLCHNDYFPDNILFEDDEITGIIDFDHAWSSHNQRDLVKAASGFCMQDLTGDWDIRAKFYEGYQEVNELDSSFEQNEPLYRVETLTSIIAVLLKMDVRSEYEKELFSKKILETTDAHFDE